QRLVAAARGLEVDAGGVVAVVGEEQRLPRLGARAQVDGVGRSGQQRRVDGDVGQVVEGHVRLAVLGGGGARDLVVEVVGERGLGSLGARDLVVEVVGERGVGGGARGDLVVEVGG